MVKHVDAMCLDALDKKTRVWPIAFSPDGRTITSGGNDRIGQIWELDESHAVTRICDATAGMLTKDVWELYVPQYSYQPPV